MKTNKTLIKHTGDIILAVIEIVNAGKKTN